MNCENAVISVRPRAFVRTMGRQNETWFPLRFALIFLFAFLGGMLLYAILSPSAMSFSCSLLVRFETAMALDLHDLPQNFLSFLSCYRWELGFLASVFLSSVTILASIFGGAACLLRGIWCGVALAHALALFRVGLLPSPFFLAFLGKEAAFCALLIYFSSRSSALFERFLTLGWHRPFAVCREICSYFVKILISCLSFLAMCAMLSLIL